jgi:RNA polymerase sigma factor (TIGR02999 family)
VSATSESPTELLIAWGKGESAARDRLIPLVYGELRRLATRYMRNERRDHTLQATALVNEVYVRLVEANRIEVKSRTHFFALAAQMMRRLLVDSARARDNIKRGGRLRRVTLDEAPAVVDDSRMDFAALDDALRKLEALHPRKVHVVELRYFGGLSLEESAAALHISTDSVKRDWRFAKAWLSRELGAVRDK